MRPYLVCAALGLVACGVDVRLEGKRCPCGPGYVCVNNTCFLPGNVPPEPDAGITDAGTVDSGIVDAGAVNVDAGVVDEWTYPEHALRRAIDLSPASFDLDRDLENFPFLIDLEDPSIGQDALPSGEDFRFTTRQGVTLDHDVERWDPGTGRLQIWVRLPTLSATKTERLWLYYGNPLPMSASSSTAVWADTFDAVFHMQDVIPGTLVNSVDGRRNATAPLPTPNAPLLEFDPGIVGQGLLLTRGSSLAFASTAWPADATVSVWIHPEPADAPGTIFHYRTPTGMEATLLVDPQNGRVSVSTTSNGMTETLQTEPGAATPGAWTHIALRSQGNQRQGTLFINGQIATLGPLGLNLSEGGTVYLGQRDDASQPFLGQLDALWIRKAAASEAWVKAVHHNHRDPSQAVSVEPSQTTSVGEAGRIRIGTEWTNVAFRGTYQDPVVVASVTTNADPEAVLTRIQTVTSTGFAIRLQEWDYQPNDHAREWVHWVALERGTHQVRGRRLEAGTLTLTQVSTTHNFQNTWDPAPIVITQVMSNQDPSATNVRQSSSRGDFFTAQLQEEEAADGVHPEETVAYIAIELGAIPASGRSIGALRLPSVTQISVRFTWTPTARRNPIVVGSMQTTFGIDPCELRFTGINLARGDVFLQEEMSMDPEVGHVAEEVGVLLLEEGRILSDL